jgi:hypothetical protein
MFEEVTYQKEKRKKRLSRKKKGKKTVTGRRHEKNKRLHKLLMVHDDYNRDNWELSNSS